MHGDSVTPDDGEASPSYLAEARRLTILLVVSVLSAFLVADYARVPTEPVHVGDIAESTVKAPFPFSYQDLGAYEAARDRAEEAALPVYLFDDAVVPALTDRVGRAFRSAREALEAGPRELPVEGTDADEEAPAPEATEAQLAARRTEAIAAFQRDLAVPVDGRDLAALAQAGFPVEAEVAVQGWIEDGLGDRLVLSDLDDLPDDGRPVRIVPRAGDREPYVVGDRGRFVTPEDVRRDITLAALSEKRGEVWGDAAEAIALSVAGPNLVHDPGRTADAREAARRAVQSEHLPVKRGEILFREGDRLTASQVARYEALQNSRTDGGLVLDVAIAGAFVFVLLAALYRMGRRDFAAGREGERDLLTLGALFLVVVALARMVVLASGTVAEAVGNDAQAESVWYLVPVAGVAMLVRVLMRPRRAVSFAVAAAAVCGLMMRVDALYVVYFLLTSLVGIALVRHMRERIELLKAGAMVGGFGAFLGLLLHFVDLHLGGGALSLAVAVRPLWTVGFAVLGGLFGAVLVLTLIPLFESFGYVTDYRLLELASLNHPLLRRLMLRAPGTYHHSVIVGTLAEAACEAIGAKGLQAKIAAYFHDIGKAPKPQYFVENQAGGVNRHHELDPVTSARIIIDHVLEGERMAREHALPKPILDNIRMHHGTGLLQYFFAKAQTLADDPSDVDEADFRYPGPKPDTREAGVVMLADKVEAATRTIQNPTEESIRAMINRIINSVMADDQFSECPLTFREIYIIADTFTSVLLGIHHQRIEYPQTRAISQHGLPEDPPTGERGGKRVGTITLELEAGTGRAVGEDADLWNDRDDTTDYEAVRNLPSGES